MRDDLTDITLVVDRSGSMMAIRDDAEGGINALIEEQAGAPGEANVTLVQFDTEYEFVHKAVPVADVPKYELRPRGNTALLDAVGKAIADTEERLAEIEESERPGLVMFVVMTDGYENSSVEYTKQQVRDLIERHRADDDWTFAFLAANPESFAEAGGMGFAPGGTAHVAAAFLGRAYRLTSDKIVEMRRRHQRGERVDLEYSDREREELHPDPEGS